MNFSETSFFYQLLDNEVFLWGLIACGVAQFSKLIFELISQRQFRLEVLLETGGMPSSHSALVTGTASGIGLQLGFNDPVFALAAIFAFVVMYDASGIRRSAGLIASKVNQMKNDKKNSSNQPLLKENLGHTRLEVFIGSLVGPLVAIPGIVFIGSTLDLMMMFGITIG